MGRKRKPDAVKKTNGTYRKDRAAPEIKAVEGRLLAKDFEFKSVTTTYNLLVKVAEETGVFSKQFSFSLRILAQDLVYYRQLVKTVNKSGFSYETTSQSGDMLKKPDPDAEALRKVIMSVRKGLAEFGWNPSDSARIAKEESDSKGVLFEALAKLMGGDDLEDEFD